MSEWKAGAAARRDARSTKDDIPRDRMGRPEPTPQQRRRKDTKRWCGGHVGREHVLIKVRSGYWQDKPCQENGLFPCHHSEQCEVCGKSLRRFLPVEECPDLTVVTDSP